MQVRLAGSLIAPWNHGNLTIYDVSWREITMSLCPVSTVSTVSCAHCAREYLFYRVWSLRARVHEAAWEPVRSRREVMMGATLATGQQAQRHALLLVCMVCRCSVCIRSCRCSHAHRKSRCKIDCPERPSAPAIAGDILQTDRS